MKKVSQNKKKEDLLDVIARNVAEMKRSMATKEDLRGFATKEDLRDLATKDDLRNLETRLTNKIDKVQESVDILEEVDVNDLQKRMANTEKDIRTLNKAVFKTS